MLFLDSNEARPDEESASENGSDDYPRIPISMDEPKEWTYTMRRQMQSFLKLKTNLSIWHPLLRSGQDILADRFVFPNGDRGKISWSNAARLLLNLAVWLLFILSVILVCQKLGAIPTTFDSLLFCEGESESENVEKRSNDAGKQVGEYPSRNSPADISEFDLSRLVLKEVVPGLYLGPYSAAIRSELQCLLEHGITHIVCVRHHMEANFIKPNFPDKFQYLVLDIADTATENIIHHFQQVKAFIDEGLNSGGQVLVHSNAGISRSAALVLAYVMETYGLSQTRAYAMVQQKRFCINPNEGFMAQLREYEPIYQAQKILRNGQQSSVRQRSKRTIHQMDTERVEDRCDEMDS